MMSFILIVILMSNHSDPHSMSYMKNQNELLS